MYNGNGYTTENCKISPNLTPGTRSAALVQENAAGEIYGSEIFLNQVGIQPDLILAAGENGIVGCVKNSDLSRGNVNTVEEAIAYMENKTSYDVPLYKEDGKTIIGVFCVGS